MGKMAVLEAIWIKSSKRGPMNLVQSAETVQDLGLAGNADQGGLRQVTVIEKEVFDKVREELGAKVDPVMRRANLLISGLKLEESIGRILRIGGFRLKVEGETKPCARMDQALPGLRKALQPHWGGGIYGTVMNDGIIYKGDSINWEEE